MSIFDIFRRRRTDAAMPALPPAPAPDVRTDGWVNTVNGLGDCNGSTAHDTFVARCPKHYSEADAVVAYSGLMGRIITLEPTTCFAKGFSASGLSSSDSEALKNYLQALAAVSKMANASTLARQYGGAIVYMRIDDGQAPDQPVNLNAIRSVSGLVVFDCTEVSVQQYGAGIDSPYFGEPLIYQVSAVGTNMRVHASRVLHFDAFPISRRMRMSAIGTSGFSPSIVDRIWESFSAYCATNAYFRQTISKLTQGALTLKGVRDGQTTGSRQSIMNRLRILMAQMSTIGDIVLDEGEAYSTTNRNVQGFSDASQVFVDWLVAETGIPRSMLMLQTQGGLSDGSNGGDHQFWANSCGAVQTNVYSPLAEKLLRYVFASKLSPVRSPPSPFCVEWPPIAQMSERELAEIYAMKAPARASDIASGVISPVEARASDDVVKTYSIDTELEESIPMYETEVGT